MKLFNHNSLMKLKAESDHLFPVVASNNGYVLAADDRVAWQFQLGNDPVGQTYASMMKEIQQGKEPIGLGTKGITPEEAYAFISRIASMPGIEDAALQLQRWASIMRELLVDVQLASRNKTELSPKTLVKIATILRETEGK